MTIKHKIKDNFLEHSIFNRIKENILHYSFPWYFQSSVAFTNKKDKNESYYFTHLFYINEIKSDFYEILQPLLEKIKIKKLLRIKANLYPNLNKKIINNKHVDYEFKHKGLIFYLNTNNGHTILKNNLKIESIENRVLFFDPSIEHSSTHCTDQQIRLNININYY
jgi:hypothetical protein